MEKLSTYQTFQPVQVTKEGDDLGRAGTIRATETTVKVGKNDVQAVMVQLDGDDEPRQFLLSDLRAL